MFRDESRHADSQVHMEAILAFHRITPRDPVTGILGCGKPISPWTYYYPTRAEQGSEFRFTSLW
jgi:hypothetical protein